MFGPSFGDPVGVMTTISGRKIDLRNPDPKQIMLGDIAHHLSIINRYAGATRYPYSVGQHSILVAMLLLPHGPRIQLLGLMHDMAEYVTNDVTHPVKSLIKHATSAYNNVSFKAMEDRIESAIYIALDVPEPNDAERKLVKAADEQAFEAEARTIAAGGEGPVTPFFEEQDWRYVRRQFTEYYFELRRLYGDTRRTNRLGEGVSGSRSATVQGVPA